MTDDSQRELSGSVKQEPAPMTSAETVSREELIAKIEQAGQRMVPIAALRDLEPRDEFRIVVSGKERDLLLAALRSPSTLPAQGAGTKIECPNCHNANKYGDYEGPACEVCLGDGFTAPPPAEPQGGEAADRVIYPKGAEFEVLERATTESGPMLYLRGHGAVFWAEENKTRPLRSPPTAQDVGATRCEAGSEEVRQQLIDAIYFAVRKPPVKTWLTENQCGAIADAVLALSPGVRERT